jgi:orsellinic acid C2-O-methyltransferase
MSTAAESSERLLELLNGFAISQIVAAAAQLELQEHLAAGPLTAEQLAARTGTHALPRLLQAWRLLGLVQRDGELGPYRSTPLLEVLGVGSPLSLSGMAKLYGRVYYGAWGELLHAVRSGRSGFEQHHGATLWTYLAEHEETGNAFHHAMTFNMRRDIPRIIESYDFSTATVAVDVGAANGELLSAVLARYPAIRGIAFDLPRVAERSGTVFEERGLADRCRVVTGDFFEAVPAGGDLYILKSVLHNWDDESALRILRNCRAAMSPGGRVLIVEKPGPGASNELPLVLKDLWMLVLFGGRDRTGAEYTQLVEQAGFAAVQIVPGTGSPMLIQAIRGD